jgi:membrane protease YdiL (CAAX protease family)
LPPSTVIYLAVSFAFAWVCWGLCWLIINDHVGLPLVGVTILGSFGPFIAAGFCAWLSGGSEGMLRFYARALEWRMGWQVFVVAFFLLPALCVAASGIVAWQIHQPFGFQMSWSEIPMAYLWLLFLGGPLGEEFGWSYLSDRLDEDFAPLLANLLLGTIWGFWHLPLFFLAIPGALQHLMPFYVFLIYSIVVRFLFSWSYHRGHRNVLSNLIIHNSLNFGMSVVVIVPAVPEPYHLRLLYLIILTAIAAFLLQRLAPAVGLRRASLGVAKTFA